MPEGIAEGRMSLDRQVLERRENAVVVVVVSSDMEGLAVGGR